MSDSKEHTTNKEITESLCRYTESKPGKRWKYAFWVSLILFGCGIAGSYLILQKGLNVMDINNSVFWGVLITNFVFWIGVSHAGTFISAILLLLHQDWRKAVNRSAEAMTIIAIIIAGLMPIIHLGRPDFFYWLLPVANKTGFILVNFTSPLSWDFYAIASYFILSLLFFQMGLLPDLATLRDRSKHKTRKYLYNYFSLGWNGSYKTWQNYSKVMFIFAGLITTLVIAVHSIVSLDFAVTQTSGWHSTLYPVYFVTGALFSGFAMVGLLAIVSSRLSTQKQFLTSQHIENINKIILTTGTLLLIFYLIDLIEIIFTGNVFEKNNLLEKYTGHYSWVSILVFVFTLLLPQLLWKKKWRQDATKSTIISALILLGMWLERFMIVVMNAENSFLKSGSGLHHFSLVSVLMAVGCAGFFAVLYLVVIRVIPMISVHESKSNVVTSSSSNFAAYNKSVQFESSALDKNNQKKFTKSELLTLFPVNERFFTKTDSFIIVFKTLKALETGLIILQSKGKEILDIQSPHYIILKNFNLTKKTVKYGMIAGISGVVGFVLIGMLIFYVMNKPLLIFGNIDSIKVLPYIPVLFTVSILFSALGLLLAFGIINHLLPGQQNQITDKLTSSENFNLIIKKEMSTDELEKMLAGINYDRIYEHQFIEQHINLPLPLKVK